MPSIIIIGRVILALIGSLDFWIGLGLLAVVLFAPTPLYGWETMLFMIFCAIPIVWGLYLLWAALYKPI